MAKLEDVIARVRAAVGDGSAGSEITVQTTTELAVKATIRALGLEVAPDGEVYNPAPAPSGVSIPGDNWRASVRPRRRR